MGRDVVLKRQQLQMWRLFINLPNKSRRKTGIAGLLLFFTDDHPRDSNFLLDKNPQSSELKSDHQALKTTPGRSRSLNSSSRNFCNDLKSVLVEASLQQQKRRRSKGNTARLMLRSKSHHDSSKSLASVELVDDNSVPICSRSISETEHQTSSPFSRSQIQADAKSNSSNSGLVIFVMSLCATIFCGRVCAILFTLILFYCMPRRACDNGRLKSVPKLPEETDKEYRKRVIMEGLLERNHHLCRGRVIN